MRLYPYLPALGLALVLSPAAPAVTIDSFEVGDFSVSDDTGAGFTENEQSNLDPSQVTRGVRFMRVTADGDIGSVSASLTTTALPDDSMSITALTAGSVNLFYDAKPDGFFNLKNGALNLNLSSFLSIDVQAVVPAPGPTFRLTLFDSSGSQFQHLDAATGANAFVLASYTNLDLTDIKSIQLTIGFLDPGALTVSDISTNPVPEPGSALLLGLGLALLGTRRRI